MLISDLVSTPAYNLQWIRLSMLISELASSVGLLQAHNLRSLRPEDQRCSPRSHTKGLCFCFFVVVYFVCVIKKPSEQTSSWLCKLSHKRDSEWVCCVRWVNKVFKYFQSFRQKHRLYMFQQVTLSRWPGSSATYGRREEMLSWREFSEKGLANASNQTAWQGENREEACVNHVTTM